MKSSLLSRFSRLSLILFSILCALMIGTSFFILSRKEKTDDRPFYLSLKKDDRTVIYPFFDEDECYLFIPSGFLINDFEIIKNGFETETDLSAYEGKDEIVIKTDHDYNVRIIQIQNLPSMFINVTINDIDNVNEDKDKETETSIRIGIYDENASHTLIEKGKIKGRGNTSWLYYDKKPYNITLDESAEILGMKSSRKWCLLSNSTEKYAIENELIYSFAKKIKLPSVSECRYVNVYIDGEYNGLYLLAEKIEAENGNPKDCAYLLETDLNQRLSEETNSFISAGNNIFEVKYPSTVSGSRIETIKKEVNDLEDALKALNSDAWKRLIDIDSWARVYLLDELFENVDGGYHSVFFYKDSNGRFIRGPIWDYDRSFADDFDVILAGNEYKFSNQINLSYNYYLLQREDFRNRVLEIFKKEFLPLIGDLLEGEIDQREKMIASSFRANQIRWNKQIDETSHKEEIMTYLKKRSEFIIDYYSHIDDYCKVQIDDNSNAYYLKNYIVKTGDKISDIDELDALMLQDKLYYKDSGIPFDQDDAINRDICLVKNLAYDEKIPNTAVLEKNSEMGVLNILMIPTFMFAFAGALYITAKRFKNE